MSPDDVRKPGDESPHDSATDLAARIADGSHVDWPSSPAGDSTHLDPATIEQLKAISAIAGLRRVTAEDGFGDASARTWGHLAVVGRIGAGQFGEVFRAWDTRLEREVALKMLHAAEPARGIQPGRAIEEARHLARVRHPNVLTVYGAEQIGDRTGIWTELIEGETLELLLAKRGPLPEGEVVAIGLDLCRALTAVHAAGIVHRDVKAQNVMREVGGRVVLMDFGTGIQTTGDPQRPGDLSGTPLYLAPEMFGGAAPNVRTDLYALSVLLFHLLTGDYPVGGANLDEIRANHQAGVRCRLSDLVPEVSEALANVIDRSLDNNPDQRFGSARELEQALMAAVPAAGHPIPPATRNSSSWFPVAAVVALLTAGGLWVTSSPASGTSSGLVCDNCVGSDRQIWGMAVSRDGRWLAVADRLAGDVLLRDLITGDLRPLRLPKTMPFFSEAPEQPGFPSDPIFSPDSRRLAFIWHPNRVTGPKQLWTVDVSTGRIEEVEEARGMDISRLYDFSPDGNRVLATVHRRTTVEHAPYELVWLSTGGDLTPIKAQWGKTTPLGPHKWMTELPAQARVSPDGSVIAYSWEPSSGAVPGRRIRHIYVLNSDGTGQEVVAVGSEGNSENPAWSSDGRRLMFTSDASGSVDLWSLPWVDGKASAPPSIVESNVGMASGLTMTSGNQAYYVRRSAPTDAIAIFNVATSTDAAVPALERLVNGAFPIWSADGSTLRFYRRQRVPQTPRPMQTEVTLSVPTGREAGNPIDSEKFPLARVADLNTERGNELFDAVVGFPYSSLYGSGAPTQGYLGDDEGMDIEFVQRQVGNVLYGFRSDSTRDVRVSAILAVDVPTGQMSSTCQLPDRPPSRSERDSVGISLSPDDRSIAVALWEKGAATLGTVDLFTCAYRSVHGPYRTHGARGRVDWMPDGRWILFSEETGEGTDARSQISKVPAGGGPARRVLALNGADRGTRFTVSTGGYLAIQLDPAFEQPFAPAGGPSMQLWRIALMPR